MHEVGLMDEAVRVAVERAQSAGATRVHPMTMSVGPISGVDREALRQAFEVVTAATPAQHACLTLEDVPTQCWCESCDSAFAPADPVFRCPTCGQLSSDVRQGHEFDLIAVEVS
jgi:hydrogenase nickel incorporation protein HypA/HybF